MREETKELIVKMYPHVIGGRGYGKNNQAKQCALIAIEEKKLTLLAVIGSSPNMWTSQQRALFDELDRMREEISGEGE